MTMPNKILFIDNHDSFTYNIVQYLQELKQDVVVWKNDAFELIDIHQLAPKAIIIGPGPCRPSDAGLSLAVIEAFQLSIPILGICLGHQAIGQAFGSSIVQAREIMHGRLSAVYHRGQGVFEDLPNPLKVTRYHSLVIDKASLADSLEVTAWTQDADAHSLAADSYPESAEIMGIRHRSLPIEGVQFHPESILSQAGYQLLNNFLQKHDLAILNNKNLPCLG